MASTIWFGDSVDAHLTESGGGGVVTLAASGESVSEADGRANIVVVRKGGSDGEGRIDYATFDGTAVAGVDYQPQAGTVVFGPGEILKTITVPLIDNSSYSGTTDFYLSIYRPVGVTLDSLTRVNVTKFDDDPKPVIRMQPSATEVMEGDAGIAEIPIDLFLEGSTLRPVKVSWSNDQLQPDAGNSGRGNVTFAPGETRKTFAVTYFANTTPEPDRVYSLSIDVSPDATSTTSRATIRVIDDDFSTISVSNVTVNENEPYAVISISITPLSQKAITLTYATADGSAKAGSDYTPSGSVTFDPRSAPSIRIPIVHDANAERTEWFAVHLTGVTGARIANADAEIQIVDDDQGPLPSLPHVRSDFDGDGFADIAAINAAGDLGVWLMNGPAIRATQYKLGLQGLSIAGIADFDGDGISDILLRDGYGNLAMMLVDFSRSMSLRTISSAQGYAVAAVSDFDGDGRADILLRDGNGNLGMWIMNGPNIVAGGFVGAPGAYTVAGAADFDGDGKSDILLRDSLGSLGIWFMDGFHITRGALLGSPAEYTVVAVADFNGDGNADIVLRDSHGNVGMWIMNHAAIAYGAFITSASGYTFVVANDYNGDGKADILLRDSSGNYGMWIMDGPVITSGGLVKTPAPGYIAH